MKHLIVLLIVILASSVAFAIEPVIEFQKGYGTQGEGAKGAFGHDVLMTPDGGYLACGTIFRENGTLNGTLPDADQNIYLIKTNSQGNLEWTKEYGGSFEDESAHSLISLSDGNYALTAWRGVRGPDILLKVNSRGEVIWEKKYQHAEGGTSAYSVIETHDKGFLLIGDMDKLYGFVGSYPNYRTHLHVIKTDSEGNVQWTYTRYAGRRSAVFSAMESKEGFLIVGHVEDNSLNGYLARLDISGKLIWEKAYNDDGFSDIIQTSDGNYVVCGAMARKVDKDGNIIWRTNIWNWDTEYAPSFVARSISETPDGGLIIAGSTQGFDDKHFLITRLDSMGNKIWERMFGKFDINEGWSIKTTSDGGYIACGDGTPPDSTSRLDISLYLIKIAPDGDLLPRPVEISRAELLQESKVMLSWENNSNAKEHILYRESEKGWENIARLGSDASFYIDENVKEGEKYCWYMAVTNTMGAGPFCNPACLTVPFKTPPPPKPALFVRGDSNQDSVIDISDGIKTLIALFQEQGPHTCPDAMDSNDDGKVNLTDAIFIFHFLLGDNTARPYLPEPFSQCGYDASEDALTCSMFSPCDGK